MTGQCAAWARRQRVAAQRKGAPMWRRIGVNLLFGLTLAVLFELFTDDVMQRAASRILVPLLTLAYPDGGGSRVTVVSIDDDDLKSYKYPWPLGLDFYARLLKRISDGNQTGNVPAQARPRAVFIDLLFLDTKPVDQVQRLLDAACAATDLGVPVFLATLGGARDPSSTEALLFGRHSRGKPCLVPVHPAVSPDAVDQALWQYPLKHATLPLQSPALGIYCRLYDPKCEFDTSSALALIWGSRAAPSNTRFVTESSGGALIAWCRASWFDRSLLEWVGWVLPERLGRWLSLPVPPPVCQYHTVVPARAFQGKIFTAKALREALAGQVVMIGTDLTGIGDHHLSPVHDLLPGVHVHAMALDNLFAFGKRYKKGEKLHATPPASEPGLRQWVRAHAQLVFAVFALALISCAVLAWRLLFDADRAISPASQFAAAPVRRRQRAHVIPWRGRPAVSQGPWWRPWSYLWWRPLWRYLGKAVQMRYLKAGAYLLVGAFILGLGYWTFDLGPMTIVAYVFFPLMADGLALGESLGGKLRDWVLSWSAR